MTIGQRVLLVIAVALLVPAILFVCTVSRIEDKVAERRRRRAMFGR